MRLLKLLFAIVVFTNFTSAQSFTEFLNDLNNLQFEERQAKVDSFNQANDQFPITEDTLAHFVYIGSGANVKVAGDFTGWDPTNGPMTNIVKTNFWYRTETFDSDARLDYKIVYNSSLWILDPKNPYTAPGGFGSNSEIRMPDYDYPEEIDYDPSIPHGTLISSTFQSNILNNSRSIKIYLPPEYETSITHYPLLLFHDGLEYISFAKTNNILDNLIAENKIPEVIALFVPPVERNPEYIDAKQDNFTEAIISELIPWTEENYRVSTSPSSRVLLGSSAGGNISLYIAMKYSEIFGKAAAFSSYIENDIISTFRDSVNIPVKMYLNHGKYDHIPAIHQSVDSFIPIISSKEYDYLFELYPEGHSYGFWRAHIDDALIYLLDGITTSVEPNNVKFNKFYLAQNYPNPFNPSTIIKYSIPQVNVGTENLRSLQLKIYDILGREVPTLINKKQKPGNYEVVWSGLSTSGGQVPSGVYFYQIKTDNYVETKKMVLIR
jgi:enterochelin esterase family protein